MKYLCKFLNATSKVVEAENEDGAFKQGVAEAKKRKTKLYTIKEVI